MHAAKGCSYKRQRTKHNKLLDAKIMLDLLLLTSIVQYLLFISLEVHFFYFCLITKARDNTNSEF